MRVLSEFLTCAFGGGRNGAYLFGLYELGIKPNLITFADTGTRGKRDSEKPETYEAIDRMEDWLQKHMGMGITWVHKDSMYDSLYDNAIRTHTLPSLAYGWHSCSEKWKIQPQEKFHNAIPECRAIWKAGNKVRKIIGYHAGEPHRAKITENEKYLFWYPLIEWGWDTNDCLDAFARHGLPPPVKSACYFCPASTKAEVLKLSQEEPELFAKAVALETNAENLRSVKGLGRRWSWSELVRINGEQLKLIPEAPEINCVCFDE